MNIVLMNVPILILAPWIPIVACHEMRGWFDNLKTVWHHHVPVCWANQQMHTLLNVTGCCTLATEHMHQ